MIVTIRRDDVMECNGERHTLEEWAHLKGLTMSTLKGRLYRGMSLDEALSLPQIGVQRNASVVGPGSPCLTCAWWKPLSTNTDITGCACHLYLETMQYQGKSEDGMRCDTWEARRSANS